jgi:hypothetical protein
MFLLNDNKIYHTARCHMSDVRSIDSSLELYARGSGPSGFKKHGISSAAERVAKENPAL